MPFENGVNWHPKAPGERGRYATFNAALDAAFTDLTTERNAFFDTLADRWPALFPSLPVRPGRYDDGKIVLYVRNPPTLYAMRMKLGLIRTKLAQLSGAPKRIDLKLEIHST
jgi:hypothetical protein